MAPFRAGAIVVVVVAVIATASFVMYRVVVSHASRFPRWHAESADVSGPIGRATFHPRRTLRWPRGFAVATWTDAARRFGIPFPPDLREVRALGATHVSIPVTIGVDTITATEVTRTPDTISDADLRVLVREARRAGLGVVLVPMLEVAHGTRSDWRGRLRPHSHDAFWASYRDAVLHYAVLAESLSIEGLCIAHELTSLYTATGSRHLAAIAQQVRSVFHGSLFVTVNFAPLDVVLPYASIDRVGVSAYFELTRDADASEAELRDAWRQSADRLRDLARVSPVPVFIAEVGYASTNGSARAPWNYGQGGVVDLEEQRRAYAAAVDVILETPEIEGAFFWIWFGPGGADDRHYTPRGKPAEREATRLFREATRTAPAQGAR